MNLHLDSAAVRSALWSARFGLERETLRVTADGRMAQTPHPFPPDHPRIVRDFCENQAEINTGVADTPAAAVAELAAVDAELRAALAARPDPEWLWPCSNPPPLADDAEVPIARFDGPRAGKTAYRERLAAAYGRRRMAFCGVHVNISLGPGLLAADADADAAPDPRRHADALYVELAAKAAEHAWLLVALTAASPVARYVDAGLIAAPTELYYPVRPKPRGPNRLDAIAETGIDRIELRMFDLNPFAPALVDARDVAFAHLLLVRLAALPRAPHAARDQILAVRNAKAAAAHDLSSASILRPDGRSIPVRDAALRALDDLSAFLAPLDPPPAVREALDHQRGKLSRPSARYADRALAAFAPDFASRVLALAKSSSPLDTRPLSSQPFNPSTFQPFNRSTVSPSTPSHV